MKLTGLATRIVVPPVAGFVLVAAYVVAESLGFRAFAQPEAATVSEAAALGEAARALQLMAAGQDPNAALYVSAGLLDHDAHHLTPIDAAVLGRHPELVRLLQRSGAARGVSAQTRCFAQMRLPEVLVDLPGGADAAADVQRDRSSNADVETTIRTCSTRGARL